MRETERERESTHTQVVPSDSHNIILKSKQTYYPFYRRKRNGIKWVKKIKHQIYLPYFPDQIQIVFQTEFQPCNIFGKHNFYYFL